MRSLDRNPAKKTPAWREQQKQKDKTMNETVITYALYLLTAVPMTIWVARTLHKNGRVFLVECFHENEELADSADHLLVVGFYLVNIGFVSLYLKVVEDVIAVRGIFEAVSAKIGVVMLVLGAMHFFNIYIFTRLRKRGDSSPAVPPLPPSYKTNPEAH